MSSGSIDFAIFFVSDRYLRVIYYPPGTGNFFTTRDSWVPVNIPIQDGITPVSLHISFKYSGTALCWHFKEKVDFEFGFLLNRPAVAITLEWILDQTFFVISLLA